MKIAPTPSPIAVLGGLGEPPFGVGIGPQLTAAKLELTPILAPDDTPTVSGLSGLPSRGVILEVLI